MLRTAQGVGEVTSAMKVTVGEIIDECDWPGPDGHVRPSVLKRLQQQQHGVIQRPRCVSLQPVWKV